MLTPHNHPQSVKKKLILYWSQIFCSRVVAVIGRLFSFYSFAFYFGKWNGHTFKLAANLIMSSLLMSPSKPFFILQCLVFLFCFVLFCSRLVACVILVPWPGTELMPSSLETQNLNHWIAREVPIFTVFLFLAFPLDSVTFHLWVYITHLFLHVAHFLH